MSEVAIGHEAHAEHPTTTGITHNKMLMWTFLASDCMFFGSLIMTYMIYRGHSVGAPAPEKVWDIPFTSVSAAILLLSSLAMVLSLDALKRGSLWGYRIWMLATAALGILFLGGQYYEFTSFYHEGVTLHSSLFGSTFFVLTGFHGTHVGIGVLWLLILVGMTFTGRLTPENYDRAEVAGLYWHFVDIVWILIFTLVYLIPYAK